MKKISLQWRLTCIITLYIALVCGCLTLLVYKNRIYYIDSLQETVDAGEMMSESVSGMATQMIRIRYISAFRRISGMSLQRISLFRCTIIKRTTKKQFDPFGFTGASWRCSYLFYQWSCTQTHS